MGCTDAINLVAYSWGRKNLQKGDRVLISAMEHHAGIVPWQIMLPRKPAAKLIPMHQDGSLDREAFHGSSMSG